MIKPRKQPHSPTRRFAMKFGIGTVLSAMLPVRAMADVLSELSAGGMVTIEKFSRDAKSAGIVRVPKVVKSESEWAALLPADSFQVTRRGQADHPYTGSYWKSRANGMYTCLCCDSALFDSNVKFESGTGWPSFMQPISALNVSIDGDAISCSLCDAHLGQLFRDGPDASGLRYSAYTLALNFVART